MLIAGGAGFHGSHTVDKLIGRNYQAIIIDNLEPQVHGKEQTKPEYLNDDAVFILQSIENQNRLMKLSRKSMQ